MAKTKVTGGYIADSAITPDHLHTSLDISSKTLTIGATTVSGHLIPSANITYDLGSSTYRFRDIYLDGDTIDLGGTELKKNSDGDIEFKSGSNFKRLVVSELEFDDGTNRKKFKISSGRLRSFDSSGASDAADKISLASNTTDDLSEGSSNLYFTNARVDARIDDKDLDFFADVNYTTTPTAGQILVWDNANQYWEPADKDNSDSIAEGSNNLYFTNARARGAISVSGNALSYNSSTGVLTANYEESPSFTGNISVSGTVDGRDIATDGTKLDTIATNADVTPSWVPSSDPSYLTSSSTQSKYLRSDTSDTASGILTYSNTQKYLGNTFWQVSSSDTAVQRADARDDDTDKARLHWYGVNASGGNTNFRHAWYDGSAYVNVDVASQVVSFSGGLSASGNITVTGTVDGRDIATDGSKLDGIESGATADQTQSEINALGITATGLSGTPSITVGTISGTTITGSDRGTFEDLVLTGDSDDDLTFTVSAGDWSILNSQQSNGLIIYDGTAGVQLLYNNTVKLEILDGGIDVENGTISIAGTEFADASRNITAGTIDSGAITSTGAIQGASFSDGTISGITFIDEDSFATNSATRVPTQQSVKAYVDAEVAGVVDSAPSALNTLNELAAALGDDANFATTTSTALGNRLRVDTASQGLTGTQQANAITNLGITATKAELNYVDGVTSNIQTQLNTKITSSDNITGTAAGLSGTPNITVGTLNATEFAGHIEAGGHLDFNVGSNYGTTTDADRFWVSQHTTGQSDVPASYVDVINLGTSSTHGIQLCSRYAAVDDHFWIRSRSDNSSAPAGVGLQAWKRLFHEDYHPNADTLTTARTIGGVSFNGSANIDLPGVNTAGNQNTSGTAGGLSGTPNITVGTVSGTTANFTTALDASLTVQSTDSTTGIVFTDPNGTGYIYYIGSQDRFYTDGKFGVNGSTIASGMEFQVNGDSNLTGTVQIGDTVQQNSYGLLQVNQEANNDESGIGILSSGAGRSMRLWTDETDSYINSGNGGSGNLIFNEAITVSSGGNLTGVGSITTNQLDLRGEAETSNLDTVGRGLYYWGSTQPSTGSPGFNYGMAWTVRDPNQNIQLAFGSSSAGRLAVRRADSGTYYDWTHFYGEGTTISGDVSSSYNQSTNTLTLTVADDSHNHVISNVDGLQTALDTKYESGDNISVGTISATSVGVTNIVTNKVVKFNGSILDDSNITDTGSLITLGSDTTVTGDLTVSGNQIFVDGSNARVKLSVWSNTTYGIGMHNSATYGGINNDYAMTFQMNNDVDRGFLWLDSDDTLAQGAMALTTDGYLTVAEGIRIGYGKTDTTKPGTGLDVSGDITAHNLTLLESSGHTTFELGSRSGDAAPAGNASYDFKPGMRVIASDGTGGTGVDADDDIIFAWNDDDHNSSSEGYLAASQTYATASFSKTFSVTSASGARFFAKVKMNDPETVNDPRIAVNGGTEYKLEYLDAPNAAAEAVNDTDSWHVVDITDDVVTGTNTFKAWLAAGQKTYIIAIYIFKTSGIMLPNEPYESVAYSHKGFGVGDTRIVSEDRNLINIGTITASGGTSTNWNTAYGWGNHASAGYLTGITSSQVTTALGYTPYQESTALSATTGAFTSNVNVDGELRLDSRYDSSNGDNVLAFKDSDGNYSIRHNVNDGNGNYSVSLGYSGAGNGQYEVTGDGVGKILFGGHGTDGFISLNSATTGTASNNISFTMGLVVDPDSVRVGASSDGTGLQAASGTRVFDASGNSYATSYTLTDNNSFNAWSSDSTGATSSINLPRSGMITFYGNSNADHSIASKNHVGTVTDDLRISSYGALYIDLDSNSNNSSNADFMIGRHGSGTGTIDELYRFSGEAGTFTIQADSAAGNHNLMFANQTKSKSILFYPYTTMGTRYSSWDGWIGQNTSVSKGDASANIELETSYLDSGASGLNVSWSTLRWYHWTSSDLSGKSAGDSLTLPSPQFEVDGSSQLSLGGTRIVDSSRNLTNIAAIYGDSASGGTTTFNNGRGAVYFENNGNSNSSGAGITLRTSSNPTTDGSIFDVRSSGQAVRFFVGQDLTSSGYNPFYVGNANTGSGMGTVNNYTIELKEDGNITAEANITAYGSVSDIRQKENIEQIDQPIERLQKIKGITFNYKKKSEDERLMGVIAQDLLEDDILKLAVYEHEDFKAEEDDPLKHTYGVRYEHLTAVLIEAVKEQQQVINKLTARIEELEK